MKKRIITALSFVVILTSCNKNEDDLSAQKTYLSKEIFSTGTRNYSYDAQGKLTSVVFSSTNETTNPSFTYTPTMFNSTGAITEGTFEYNDTTLSDSKIVNVFNADGKISTYTEYIVEGNTVRLRCTFEYAGNKFTKKRYNVADTLTSQDVTTTSATGNITKIEYFNIATSEVNRITEFSGFDDKISPTTLYPAGWLVLSGRYANNYGNQLTTVVSTGASTNYTYVYEYNADGYATKRTASDGTTISYQYIKQ